ncbi:cation:proton antiporter [Pacificimonas flava]|uniref:Na+/H+ antiporter, CPA1 family protein n=1 Tax=Pacificimonas flava TaxID=1234595 RepID=M2TQA4_9SPHN|nr:cation:proton antiporter [Pacificimonas flava]EMD83936.1 Na+/H+ antiporter, CPA1 family protein [Pacificimonas flava]MBB5281091.1 NhaP-type Na+/H+ or K+/H+ antiporter [Pacificimonas flava]
MDEALFGVAPYHILLAGCGFVIIVAYWLPRFLIGHEPAPSGLLIVGGALVFGFLPGMPEAFNPLERPILWELLAEVTVILALFGTGLRIDRVFRMTLWSPTIRLLLVAMPLSVLAVAALGLAAGMSLAAAVLLAAALAPTDPVLAQDVQVGPPLEGGEHPVRFALTTEAGLNDGLAFPFVYLSLFIGTYGSDILQWGGTWAGFYLVYKIVLGGIAGIVAGKLLGQLIFAIPSRNILAESGSGVVALAGVLFTYGLTELLEGYGFIAAFIMGIVLRQREAKHAFHTRLHGFSEAIEHAVTAIMLVLLGGTLPLLFDYLTLTDALIGCALVFLIRPAFGLLSLIGTPLHRRQRGVVAFYGVRGIGSIYYLAYACGQFEFDHEERLWATAAFTILLSTLIHGFTAGSMVWAATHEDDAKGPA